FPPQRSNSTQSRLSGHVDHVPLDQPIRPRWEFSLIIQPTPRAQVHATPMTLTVRDGKPPCGLSEIRLFSSRNRSVFFGTVFVRVFGTDIFRPVAEHAPIGFGREP